MLRTVPSYSCLFGDCEGRWVTCAEWGLMGRASMGVSVWMLTYRVSSFCTPIYLNLLAEMDWL